MNKPENLTKWLMECPQLAQLYNITAEERDGANIIFPVGSSTRRTLTDDVDITGCYCADIQPNASVYEEYQINCYKSVVNSENDWNILKFGEVEKIIEWIGEQDEKQNFPDIGEKIVMIDTYPFVPQTRFIDPESGIACYYITLRITYVNKAKGRSLEWQEL